MKKLNLNACGVSEMNTGDMKVVEGGCFLVAFAIGFAVALVCELLFDKGDPDCKEETGC
jgi:hypothetical protein